MSKALRGMSCSVVPGMADSVGRRRAVPIAAGSNCGEPTLLISFTNALHAHGRSVAPV